MATLVSTGQLTINDYNDGMTVYLSNEGMSLPASETGVVTDFTGASSTMFIFLGQVDDSGSWNVTATPSTGIAGALGSGPAIRTFTITSLTAESAYVDFNATKPGFLPLTRRFSVSKARKGADGTDGTPGGPGNDGVSAKKAYCASSTPTTNTAPAGTTGINSVPGINQGGVVGTWVLVTPSLATGQYLWVCDGSYSPVTNQITWSVPYWGSLRVGNLSAVAVDTGGLNVSGDITTTNGYISLKADGSATFKSLTITGAGANPILAPGDSTIKMGGLPNGVKNTEAQFTPTKTWEFRNTYDGFSFGGSTPAAAVDSVIVTSVGADPTIYINGLSIDGKVNDRIRMRVKRNAGTGWQGGVYWANVGHVFVGGSVLSIADTTSSAYSVLEWDMSSISDWTSNINSGIRFDLGATSGDVFEIDWISVGKMGPASTSNDTSNLVDLSWWVRDGTWPWTPNGAEYNRLIMLGTDVPGPGPKGVNDVVWFCQETTGNSAEGGGWDASMKLTLDPTKTYRFAIPIKRIDGSGSAYWGPHNVCDLNTTVAAGQPYFAASGIAVGTWYLFVGYLFPAGSTGNTNDGAGIYDCTTGALVTAGNNYNLKPNTTTYTHRAYQFYAALNSKQIFGRPQIHLVDGTEPSLRDYFSASAVLNSGQLWSQVSGAGRPADNATVGADATNLNVGVGQNLLFNSLPNNVIAFTTPGGTGNHGQSLEGGGPLFAPRGHAFDIYTPFRQCAYIHIPTVTPTSGTFQDVHMNVNAVDKTPVYPNRRYEASAFLSNHRCAGSIRIVWYDSAGTYLSDSAFSNSNTSGASYTAGNAFPRAVLFATSPAAALYASVVIRQTHNGGADPYTFWSGVYFGEALAAQTVFTPWADGSPLNTRAIGYNGDLNASADLTLIPSSSAVTITGNTITRVSGTAAWDTSAYSKVGYTNGAYATATASVVGMHCMFGLDIDPVGNGSTYTGIDYAIFLQSEGSVYTYENGASTLVSTWVVGDVFTVKYDGTRIAYEKNGVNIRSVNVTITVALYFDSSIYELNKPLTNVRFGPLSSNNWALVGGTGKPSDNASADVTLIGRGVLVTGNYLTKTGIEGWIDDCYSKESYAGGAFASGTVVNFGEMMIGLNTDPLLDRSYSSLDYAWYMQIGGGIGWYESNVYIPPGGLTYAIGDILTVTYDGTNVRYLKNGVIHRTVAANITAPLFFDSAMCTATVKMSNIRFGPMTSNNWAAIGGTGKPSDNATSDITLIGRGTTITGNKITNGPGSPWTNDAYSKNGFTGGAYATATLPVQGFDLMFGLDANPTQSRSYEVLDWAFYFTGTQVRIYESGVDRGQFASYVAGDVFTVTYDGAAIIYYHNGTKLRSVTIDITSALYFDSSFIQEGAYITNVGFGPMSNTSWIANGYTEGGMGHVVRPTGGAYSNSPVSGVLAISLPTAVFNSGSMVKFKVEIYEYSTGKSCSFVISGYNYSIGPLWYNVTAEYNGPTSANKIVRFGQDAGGTRNVVWIGRATGEAGGVSTWQYPQIRVTEVSIGYANYEHNRWMTGWNLTIADTVPPPANVNNQVYVPSVGGAMAGIDSITASNVASYIGASAIGNAQFGGDLYSTNWGGTTGVGGAGWYLERVGNFYGYNIKVRGSIMSGGYNSWAWPAAGTGPTNMGFYLGYEGLLMGNYNNGKYIQISNEGNITAPQFTIINGAASFSGTLTVGATTNQPLSSLTTDIGNLRARTTGGRTEIANDIIRVYDSSNNLRIKIGYLL